MVYLMLALYASVAARAAAATVPTPANDTTHSWVVVGPPWIERFEGVPSSVGFA